MCRVEGLCCSPSGMKRSWVETMMGSLAEGVLFAGCGLAGVGAAAACVAGCLSLAAGTDFTAAGAAGVGVEVWGRALGSWEA